MKMLRSAIIYFCTPYGWLTLSGAAVSVYADLHANHATVLAWMVGMILGLIAGVFQDELEARARSRMGR